MQAIVSKLLEFLTTASEVINKLYAIVYEFIESLINKLNNAFSTISM